MPRKHLSWVVRCPKCGMHIRKIFKPVSGQHLRCYWCACDFRPGEKNARAGRGMDDELLGRQSAFNEAALYRMVGDENPIEELRELIAVPPMIGRVLRGFAKADPRDANWILAAINFRETVLLEYRRAGVTQALFLRQPIGRGFDCGRFLFYGREGSN